MNIAELRMVSGKLRRAANLVAEALAELDTKSVPCSCCDAKLFANYDQAKVAEQLDELPTRLERAAERVDGSIDWTNGATPTRSSIGYRKVVNQVTDAATSRQETER